MGKASFDRAVAAVVLVLLAPVLLGVAVCVKATSPGPVFVRLPRVGRDGRVFHLLKFRTTDDGTAETGHVPAVTPVGAVLRRYSIDELPQFLNVLKGDMSIVGPRPRPPSGVTRLGVDEHRRSPVKPGLTGLVQVSRRTGGPRADGGYMAVPDYVENWSLRLDLAILRVTVVAVLRGIRSP
jgi:lipopolysaccharide/colanic/teichoic acid biosynthesis glycosyltransferase